MTDVELAQLVATASCDRCGAKPVVTTGLPVSVWVDDGGLVATVCTDLSELPVVRADEIDFVHADGCPGVSEEHIFGPGLDAVKKLMEHVRSKYQAPEVEVAL